MAGTSGRNSKLPTVAGSAMNSTVTSRFASTASRTSAAPDFASALPTPAILQNTSYSGTSAQPNAKLPAVMISRLRVKRRLARLRSLGSGFAESGVTRASVTTENRDGDEPQIESQRHRHQHQSAAADQAPPVRHLHRAHLISGATVKLWNGGGDGKVHSSPVGNAPSHTAAEAFWPPRTHWMIRITNRICEAPNAKPPIEDTMF